MSGYRHSRLETSGLKPLVSELAQAEIVINEVDKVLYTKDAAGVVIAVGGGIDEAPVDGNTYGRSNAGWTVITSGGNGLSAPTISGNTSGNEKTTETLTITNYNADFTYVVTVSGGSFTKTGDSISWTLPSVTVNTSYNMTVQSTLVGFDSSSVTSYPMLVIDVLQVDDQALVYDSTTMTEFTTLTNTALTDTNTTLSAILNNPHEAVSNVINQDAGDTDFKGLNTIVSKLEFPNISYIDSSADTLASSTKIQDGDDMVILLDDEVTYQEFVASGVVFSTANDTTSTVDIFGDGSGKILYEFEGNTNDTSGNYNSASTNITYVAGKFSQGADFISASATMPLDIPIYAPSTFSNSIWINISTAATDGSEYIISNRNGGATFLIRISSSGTIAVEDWSTAVYDSGINIVDGIWHHIVMSMDAGVGTLYIDKVAYATGFSYLPQSIANGNSIGSFDGGNTALYSGKVDQFRFINRALSQPDVDSLYNEIVNLYTLDTTVQTAGEIPTRAFAVGAKSEFEIDPGTYLEAVKATDTYTDGTTAIPVLKTTRTHNDIVSGISSRTITTKQTFSNAGSKLTELTATITKLEG